MRPFIAIALALLPLGCASTPAESPHELTPESSAQFLELAAELDALNDSTANLAKDYQAIQSTVLANADFSAKNKIDDNAAIDIYINENNVILVNGQPMSRNDFATFVGKNFPARCTPTPKLTVHARANYDIAAAVLETIYTSGCTNVHIP